MRSTVDPRAIKVNVLYGRTKGREIRASSVADNKSGGKRGRAAHNGPLEGGLDAGRPFESRAPFPGRGLEEPFCAMLDLLAAAGPKTDRRDRRERL